MIQIYAPGNTNFDRNGDVALQPSLCDLDMTLNGEWELEIEAPADELGKFRAVTTGAVVAVPTPWSDKQLFRIYDHDTSDEGSVGLARPIFLDAENEVMILDKRPTNCIGQEALDAILSGTKYKGKSNITKTATAYYIRKNAIQAIASNEENSFINRWGGEIAYDNFTVTVNERMGRDRGLRVEFGRNIKSIHDHGNSEELATRIYPVAYNGRMISGDKQYVDSERIGDYPIVYSKILECQDIKLREDLIGEPSDGDIVCDTQAALDAALRQRCAEEYAAGADVLETAYDVDMDDLSTKEEYAEYKNLEKVELGDTVHCRHRRLKISADARTVRLVWNCILRKNKKLYIGDYKQDYFARLNDTAQRLQDLRDEMVESEGRVNQAVREASERLDKALKEAAGLYCTEKDDGKGGTIILLHDKKTLEESTNVIMLTADAIGFSTDGGHSYPYGFTIDGEFVARLLSAHGINADWIRAGILQSFPDEEGNIAFFLDLLQGILNMNATSLTIKGKTVENISDASAAAAVKEFMEGTFTDTMNEIRGQVDQKAESWYQAADPSTAWTTPEQKAGHKGDMWRVPGQATAKQWDGAAWVDMTVNPPQAVFDEIDGKAQIWASQPKPPYHENDLWFGGTSSEIKICTTTRESGDFVSDDWIKYDYYINKATADASAAAAVDAQTQTSIFNKLTNGSRDQGIYLENGKLYINASYLKTGILDIALLLLSTALGGVTDGVGQTAYTEGGVWHYVDTHGIMVYGPNGVEKDASGNVIGVKNPVPPPFLLITNAGGRLQAQNSYVYASGYLCGLGGFIILDGQQYGDSFPASFHQEGHLFFKFE